MYPHYTKSERLVDGIIHAIGIILSLIGIGVLLSIALPADNVSLTTAAALYSAGLIAMFGFSAAYNGVADPSRKERLRRCDHAAIYLMIAGSYTPFTAIGMGNAAGYTLLAGVWVVAITGVTLKLGWPRRFERASIALYVVLGWMGLGALSSIVDALPATALVLLGAGGVLYTAGVLFHLWTSLKYQNAIWHAFVLIAAGCHYFAILEIIRPA